jgi:hypothetical protein
LKVVALQSGLASARLIGADPMMLKYDIVVTFLFLLLDPDENLVSKWQMPYKWNTMCSTPYVVTTESV